MALPTQDDLEDAGLPIFRSTVLLDVSQDHTLTRTRWTIISLGSHSGR